MMKTTLIFCMILVSSISASPPQKYEFRELRATPTETVRAYLITKTTQTLHQSDILGSRLRALLGEVMVVSLMPGQTRARKLLSELRSPYVPALFLEGPVASSDAWRYMQEHRWLRPAGAMFVFEPPGIVREYLHRQRVPNRLDVFANCLCPASMRVLRAVLLGQKLGLISSEVHIYLRALAAEKPHPADEYLLAAIALQKSRPELLSSYLFQKETGRESDSAVSRMSALGIPEKEAKHILQEEAPRLQKEDIRFADELGITLVPALLWENQVLLGLPEDLLDLEPFRRLQELQLH